jgi:hypothetical protein
VVGIGLLMVDGGKNLKTAALEGGLNAFCRGREILI